MPGDQEASLRCLQSKPLHNPLDGGVAAKGLSALNDKISNPPAGFAEGENSTGNENFVHSDEGYHRPIYPQDFRVWSAFHPNSQRMQQHHWNYIHERIYPMNRVVENNTHYMPFKMFSQAYPQDFQFQEFQYFVVIDFEATCDKEKNLHPQEIIEFPSVLVNSVTGQLEASFQTYVRPVYHQLLSDFCKELTGIQQIQVDRGVPLSEALLMHDKWLEDKGIKHTNFAVVTWSNWDCGVMLESECRFKRIRKPPYTNRWINLKVPFHKVFRGIRCNLKEAVQLAGLAWEGHAHCGLDDARNTALLLTHLMHRGFRFSITNSLMWQATERPLPWNQSPDRLMGPIPHDPSAKHPGPPAIQFHPQTDPVNKDWRSLCCYCGVKSCRHGSFFFGCGNWTATRGALCPYFEWALSP